MDQSQKTKDTSQTPESRSRRVYRQRVGAFSESRPDRSFGGSVFGVENGWEEPSLHRKDVVGSFLALSHGRKTPQAFIRLFHRGLSKSFSRSKPISQFLQNFSRVHPGSSVRQFPSFIYFFKKKNCQVKNDHSGGVPVPPSLLEASCCMPWIESGTLSMSLKCTLP